MEEVFFIEHYCLVNGKHIILKDYQKKFIDWLKRNENYRINKGTSRYPLQRMRHIPVNHVKFPVAEDFIIGLKDNKEYVDDFNMIFESAVLS